MTWWTRHDTKQPEVTDNEDSDEEDDETILKNREEQTNQESKYCGNN